MKFWFNFGLWTNIFSVFIELKNFIRSKMEKWFYNKRKFSLFKHIFGFLFKFITISFNKNRFCGKNFWPFLLKFHSFLVNFNRFQNNVGFFYLKIVEKWTKMNKITHQMKPIEETTIPFHRQFALISNLFICFVWFKLHFFDSWLTIALFIT